MTYCSVLAQPIKKKVEEDKKTIDQIAEELCPDVKKPRQKVIRIIKTLLGDDYLIQHADTLDYHPEKVNRKKAKLLNPTKKDDGLVTYHIDKSTLDFNLLLELMRRLISAMSIEEVKRAISIIEQDKK